MKSESNKSNVVAEQTTSLLIESFVWGVEPDNAAAIEQELKNRGVDTSKVAKAVDAYLATIISYGDAAIARYEASKDEHACCCICSKNFIRGEVIARYGYGASSKLAHESCYKAVAKQVVQRKPLGSELAVEISKHLDLSKAEPAQIEKTVTEVIDRELEKRAPRPVKITMPDMSEHISTTDHYQFAELLQMVSLRIHTFLVGPAGSSKTTAAARAAEVTKLPFYAMSCGPQTSQYQFMGHIAPDGKYHTTMFRKAFEEGGVFLADEIDASNAGVLTILNAGLSNPFCAFPDKMVKRHKDFVVIAAGNTYGTGANRVYVGRNQLDAATIDRFAYIEWNYDESAEVKWSGNRDWTSYVQRCRTAAEQEQVRHVISPRASINGAKMLAAGMSRERVEQMVIWKGIAPESKQRILNRVNNGAN